MRALYKLLLIVIVLVALFLGFWKSEQTVDEVRHETVVSALMDEFRGYEIRRIIISGNEYNVFIADTPELRSRGLSEKTGLPTGFGMEFVFETPGSYGFWMKDMKFPLDIIWVRDSLIVDVWENAQPPTGAYIPSYSPKGDADRVYEFGAGFVKERELMIGDQVI